MLLRGAYYPSFGKPDDGLGFAPQMCDHLYGSTAIAGLVDYVADKWPAEYRDTMFVGNVVTNVVNHCRLTPRGSWFHADDLPDFCVSADPWFRPVNLKLGPDGASTSPTFTTESSGTMRWTCTTPAATSSAAGSGESSTTGRRQGPAAKMPDLSKRCPRSSSTLWPTRT